MIAGEKVTAERSGSSPFRILLDDTTAVRLRLTTKPDKATKAASVSNKEWKRFLGHAMFGLPETLEGSAYREAYTPGFRSMFSHFARGTLAANAEEAPVGTTSAWREGA